eukprot:EG_transcript_27791
MAPRPAAGEAVALRCGHSTFLDLDAEANAHRPPAPASLFTRLPVGGVRQVAAGYSASYVLLDDGRVVDASTGCAKLSVPGGVRRLVAGLDMYAAVNEGGGLFVWGEDSSFPRVTGDPARISGPGLEVVDVSVGRGFLVLVDAKGKLFSCGSNLGGGLGRPDLPSSDDIVEVELPTGELVVSSVCCQWACHCIAVTSTGRLLVWGTNTHGQLGLGSLSGVEPRPKWLETLP